MTRGEAKRKVREEFFNAFQVEFFKEFENGAEILTVFGKRPQERWLYGFIGQALAKVLRAEKPMPLVLTELPVARRKKGDNSVVDKDSVVVDDEGNDPDDKPSCRVDYVFGYQGYLIYMEVKAAVIDKPWDSVEGEKRLKKSWDAAMNQLRRIKLDRKLSSKFDTKKSIRFALLFVTCGKKDQKNNLISDVEAKDLKIQQAAIYESLNAEFTMLRVNKNSRPYSRNTLNPYKKNDEEKMRRDYGWMLFAGYK
ncbi:MAG: hypothetical protein PXX77_01520 [Gallionella sp.]|nr:hypothetical protein [Gallionella sp.]